MNALAPSHLIGPNAIIQMIKTMEEDLGVRQTIDFFIDSKLSQYISHPLVGRVHEEDVCLIHQRLIETYGIEHAKRLSWQAGEKTADYLLKNRIPKLMGLIFKSITIYIESNPICKGIRSSEPVCDYYAGTFEGLFKSLIDTSIEVKEVGCEAQGDLSCSFRVVWFGHAF